MNVKEFICKAKWKIAELSTLIATNQETDGSMDIIIMLSDFLECLEDPYFKLSEDNLQEQIDILAYKANLINVPLLPFPDDEDLHIMCGCSINTIYSIQDYIEATTILIKNIQHYHSIEDVEGLREELDALKGDDGEDGAAKGLYDIEFVVNLGGSKTLGKYTTGQTVKYVQKSLPFIIEDLGVEETFDSYQIPSASLATNGPTVVEAGTMLNHVFTPSFTKNDAGPLNNYKLIRSNIQVISNPGLTNYTESRVISDQTLGYHGVFPYDEGEVKVTSSGREEPMGKILAGSIQSNTINIKGARNVFFGFNRGTLSSADIRSFQNALLDAGKGSVFLIDVPAGATSIQFAYVSSMGVVSKVEYVTGLNTPVINNGVSLTQIPWMARSVNVNGANGFTAVPYTVWSYSPAEPFTTNVQYRVSL